MARPPLLAGVLAALAVAGPARGQQSKPDSSTCATVFAHRAATRVDSLVVAVEPNYQLAGVPDEALQTLAISVATALELPRPIVFPPVAELDGDTKAQQRGPVSAAQTFIAEAAVMLDRQGAVAPVRVRQTALEPSLDSALVAAVRSALLYGLPPAFIERAREQHGGMVSVRFFAASPQFFSAVRSPDAPRSARVTLGAVRVPTFTAGITPRYLTGPQPKYPPAALANGVDGKVLFEFAIDPTGRVIQQTLVLRSGTALEFAAASASSLLKMRFAPGTVEGCPVTMVVQQPFTFKIGH